MPNLASDDGAIEPRAEQKPEDVGQASQPAQEPAQEQAPDASAWLEPKVQSLAIFTELFQTGDKSESDLEQLLSRYTTTMAWTEFWSREGYISEVVKGSERRYALSMKGALVLELPSMAG